jgi:hypothetical protein
MTEVPIITEGIKATPKLERVQVEKEVQITREVPKEVRVCPCAAPPCQHCPPEFEEEFSTCCSSYSTGREVTNQNREPGHGSGSGRGHGRAPMSADPAALEAFWRKQVPQAFHH